MSPQIAQIYAEREAIICFAQFANLPLLFSCYAGITE